jgi:hypothetical protein
MHACMCVLWVCMYVCVCLCAPTYTPISPCLGPDAPDLVCGNAAAEHGVRTLRSAARCCSNQDLYVGGVPSKLGVLELRFNRSLARNWICYNESPVAFVVASKEKV